MEGVIISDLVDYDELHTGQRREGTYLGWQKHARGLIKNAVLFVLFIFASGTYVSISAMPNVFMGVAGRSLPLLVMAAAGYTPNVAQSEQFKLALTAMI